MTTVTYALKITLVDENGTPIIRCWGPSFNVVDGVPSSPGWHHYIISFDSSIPRVQMAMDRGGGPILGGGILDTQLGTGEVDASGGFPSLPTSPVGGTAPQQMFATLKATSLNGFAPSPGTLNVKGQWAFNADLGTVTDFAYGYFGVSTTDTFFNLTNSANLNLLVTAGLQPVNLGAGGESVTPLACRFMHTGDATLIGGISPETWNAGLTYQPGDYVVTHDQGVTRFWLALPLPSSKLTPPGPNRDRPPSQWGLPLEGGGNIELPYAYWMEVEPPLIGPEFCWNAANGLLAPNSGIITTVAGP